MYFWLRQIKMPKNQTIKKEFQYFHRYKIGGNLLFNNPHNLNTFLKIISKKRESLTVSFNL